MPTQPTFEFYSKDNPLDEHTALQVIALYEQETGRQLDRINALTLMKNNPSVIGFFSNSVFAFSYSKYLAPDIMEIDNLYVAIDHRNQGYGSQLLSILESQCSGISMLLLVNSDLYQYKHQKKPATTFYKGNGYSVVAETQFSRIICKKLTQ